MYNKFLKYYNKVMKKREPTSEGANLQEKKILFRIFSNFPLVRTDKKHNLFIKVSLYKHKNDKK